MALNCVANGKILRDGRFEQIWIQPAAGDAGGAVGAALLGYHHFAGAQRRSNGSLDGDAMSGSYLGPSYSEAEIRERLIAEGARFDVVDDEQVLLDRTAAALAGGRAVGWFQGRMEFGPRALGNRSILADPRNPEMQKILNLKVKYRESFRPFAPAVLAEDVQDWFELDRPSPYMLLVADVAERHRIDTDAAQRKASPGWKAQHAAFADPGNHARRLLCTGADGASRHEPTVSCVASRIQAANRLPRPGQHQLQRARRADRLHPEDAFRCLMGTEIEMLVIGNCILQKDLQNPELLLNYRDAFDPD